MAMRWCVYIVHYLSALARAGMLDRLETLTDGELPD